MWLLRTKALSGGPFLFLFRLFIFVCVILLYYNLLWMLVEKQVLQCTSKLRNRIIYRHSVFVFVIQTL